MIAPSVSIPAARPNPSNDPDTSSHALPTGALGMTLVIVLDVFMALLSFRGISTPSLPAQGEQRRLLSVQHRPGQFPDRNTRGFSARLRSAARQHLRQDDT